MRQFKPSFASFILIGLLLLAWLWWFVDSINYDNDLDLYERQERASGIQ